MASVEAQIPEGLTAYPLPGQASAITGSLVTLGALALRQQTWQPLPYHPEKGTGPGPGNHPFLHVSSDGPFIISGTEPMPGEHTFCQPIDTAENRSWQCFGMESITSVTLDTQQPLHLKTHRYQSTVLRYSHEPKLTFPEYDLPDYRIFLQRQQAEMERIHKIAVEELAMGRVKIRIAEAATDADTARKVYIAKTNGITVREQKDIEQEAERHREDAHVQSDDSVVPLDIDLPDGTVLCLASTRKACQEVLSKIVSCPNSEPGSTRENTSAPSQEGGSKTQNPPPNPNQNTQSSSASKRHFDSSGGVPTIQTPLAKRLCRLSVSDQVGTLREQLGGKGMFLQRMKDAGLNVPPFQCVTTQVVKALEQHPLNPHSLARYLPDIACELGAQTSLAHIRGYLNTLLPSEHVKRTEVLKGLAEFIVSDDFYQQVKESEAAQQIRDLRSQLDKPSQSPPVIVRSSGIHEDNYGDAQAGKYLSLVQEEDDVLRTCLKVMASGYRPEVCPEGIPQPMALIIQECIDCQCGGVIMSFQSFQNRNIGVEFTRGQPRGVVAGQSGNTPHRIDIAYEEGPDSYQYFPGAISSHYVLRKSNNGYSETRIDNTDTQKDDVSHLVTDKMVSDIREMVTKLENLLRCPVDAEFGINPEGELCVLQARPVTQLSGDMNFAMPIPEEAIATGAGVSEGFCTGTVWLADKGKADTMPEGAIVVADHIEDWMLDPEFLKRVGGIVIARGGSNDHFAIGMKQQQKTLMLAGDQFEAVAAQAGQQATLACARFNDEPGAFIVAGDISGQLATFRKLSSPFDVPQTKAVPSRDDLSFPEGTFLEVASGFQWLTDQNARLLAFFAPGGGLDCLANPVKLSMSPQRSRILAETKDNVKRLVHGAQALLQGYRAFLKLAGEKGSSEVQLLRDELPQLISRFERLKRIIRSGRQCISIPPQQSRTEGLLSFRAWLAVCHLLQSVLQALNPKEAEQVRSVHELIFALHQRFVNALAPVTLDSGQGKIFTVDKITYVDCTTPGKKASLLSCIGEIYINKLQCSGTVVSMDDALIVNLKLGAHMSLIELLEDAEGGKGRTLRLRFSDNFDSNGSSQKSGKLKRMWFLAQLLKAIELDKEADGMKVSVNPVAGEMIVECPRVKLREALQYAFEKLIIALQTMKDLDVLFNGLAIVEGDQWSFNLLEQRLNSDTATQAHRFAFQHCLFRMVNTNDCDITPDCYQLLSNDQQQFVDHSRWLIKSKDNLGEWLRSDKIAEDARREFFYHFLLSDIDRAMPWLELVYPHLKDEYFVIEQSCSDSLKFYIPPGQPSGEHKEKIRNFLRQHGLKYASPRVRNDKGLVLEAVAKHRMDLQYVSEGLKDDEDVVLAAVNRNGRQLEYASQRLRDNENIVKAALADYPGAMRYAGEGIRDDKDIVKMAATDQIYNLSLASKTLLSDREYMLGLIRMNAYAFNFAAPELKADQLFVASALRMNSMVKLYLKKVPPKT